MGTKMLINFHKGQVLIKEKSESESDYELND